VCEVRQRGEVKVEGSGGDKGEGERVVL